MEKHSPKVDEYIEKSQDFAKPVLNYLRELVHECCPDVEEAMKWSFPNFTYKGKILCSMASFKQHCTFGFWLEREMKTMQEITKDIEKNSMFSLGKITNIKDLPLKPQLKNAIKEAMELTDMGITVKKASSSKIEIEIPDYFLETLSKNKKVLDNFNNASSSFRKEYINWITKTKTEATRNKRMEQSLEWIAENKGRNWKYEKK
ncbi:hypothetical protein ACM39_02660 [Chryseobacterium sp. FH2]|uniref:YdeI/OmpD-associated family protein n=1 Tax=Chryseobacterium sp. FH2 TaxID=1674291 RepID=UPI00065ACD96|nr:YdeI/OmpD-associated family protein [Chryseobacterium sp. FH2]KMQ69958.1 hypothetical protein ACM39_02660 [Chryseobacterium sp. FH2]